MEFEVLKRNHLKRNIIIAVIVISIISAIILNFTSAKYRVTDSIPLINGTINYKPYDFKLMAMYQEQDGEYVEVDKMPSSGYVINEEKSYCTIDNVNKDEESVLYTNDNGEHVISGLKKNSKCYLYFDEGAKFLKDVILSGKSIKERRTFTEIITEISNDIIYQAEDDLGTTYYFSGNVTNNYVYFAGFYWRIIRINGNNSIRIIYQGASATSLGADAQIDTGSYNGGDFWGADKEFVGYMYTQNQDHGLSTNSVIKSRIDLWYEENLSAYGEYLDSEAGFCNDRTIASDNVDGWGSESFNAYERLTESNFPTFKCEYDDDLFTTSTSSIGNNALEYPIGLITADEVVYAGSLYAEPRTTNGNTSYFLYTGANYWTMSPSLYYNGTNGVYAQVMLVDQYGNITSSLNKNYDDGVYITAGIRPVINLRSDAIISEGNGTINSPYIVY